MRKILEKRLEIVNRQERRYHISGISYNYRGNNHISGCNNKFCIWGRRNSTAGTKCSGVLCK